jgi:uncharacterized alpha-E superfamily protein
VYFALALAERCLAELAPPAGRAGFDDEARRVLGRARTDLEFRRVDDLLGDLPSSLAALEQACSDASTAIAGRYFRQAAPIGWTA